MNPSPQKNLYKQTSSELFAHPNDQLRRKTKVIKQKELLTRISINPNICFGKPCIRGHRIWVSLVLDFLASGTSIPELLKEYPQLQPEDIYACIAYGAAMSSDHYQKDNLKSFALRNLEQCYGEDEPEYSLELIKEHNSNYART